MTSNNPILHVISNWFKRNFSDPEALALFFTLFIAVLLIEFFGKFLLPVIISIILAYLLNSPVKYLERWRFPRQFAVIVVYVLFLGLFAFAIFGLIPLFWKQLVAMMHEFPRAFTRAQMWATEFMHHYPKVFSENPLGQIAFYFREQSAHIGKFIVSFSLATIPGVVTIVLYLVLVPLLVFFFLKDGKLITNWVMHYLPKRRGLIHTVWFDVNEKIGAYVRGRVLEILIVSLVSIAAFELLGLQYAFLLGALVGLSVIVPYIGAVVVTIPVVVVSLMQWGLSAHCAYFLIIYAVIIALDANVLVPLLFSGAMELHPIVIILAVLIFGGLWGFWGVFFAIPLATLIKAILDAWPKAVRKENSLESQ